MALKLMITNGQNPKYRNSMWGWSTGGMTLKVNTDVCGEKKKTCPGAILLTTIPTQADIVSNLRLRSERPGTTHMSHGMVFNNRA
jgi:hypothetical protein